jgi:hypothetical protein
VLSVCFSTIYTDIRVLTARLLPAPQYQATGSDGKRQHTVAAIAEAVGVHRSTVYDYFKKER